MKFQAFVALVSIGALGSSAYGVGSAGYASELLDAKAMGQANAFVAEADNPSAIYYNPAGLTQLSDTQLSIGMAAATSSTKRTGEGVPDDKMKSELSVLPNFYLTTKRSDNDHPWAIGI